MRALRLEADLRHEDLARSNIDHALSLNLPSCEKNPKANWAIDLFASGPSSRGIPKARRTAAVNNAINQFGPEGPTYWIACDPQELVASFIPADPPTNTTYLLATKCHPSVFQKLQDRKVLIWQTDEHELAEGVLGVPTAISVTLCAINVLAQMGCTAINTHGWDGCFINGEGYAIPQEAPGTRKTLHMNGVQYQTTDTWAAEAEDAVNQFTRDRGHYSVKINGPGMIGDIVRHFGLAA